MTEDETPIGDISTDQEATISEDSKESEDNNNNMRTLMEKTFSYPSPEDPDFQNKIYNKREFYYHKIPAREELKTYDDIKDYRTKICSRKFELQEHQSFLSNFINPDTPYKGLLVFHGTGTQHILCPC